MGKAGGPLTGVSGNFSKTYPTEWDRPSPLAPLPADGSERVESRAYTLVKSFTSTSHLPSHARHAAMSYAIRLNETPHATFDSEQAARRAVRELFGPCELSDSDSNVMFWPSVSARGHVMVEIKRDAQAR